MLRPYLQSVPDHVQGKAITPANQKLDGFPYVSQGVYDCQKIFLVIGPGAFPEGLAGHWQPFCDVFQDVPGEAVLLSHVGTAALYV